MITCGFWSSQKRVNFRVKFKASDVRFAVKVRTCHSLSVVFNSKKKSFSGKPFGLLRRESVNRREQ